MIPDRRGRHGLLDSEQVPLEWRELDALEDDARGRLLARADIYLTRAIAELRSNRRMAESGRTDREMVTGQWHEIAGLRNRIREHEQERDAWAAAGKRMRAEADAQIDQYRRDFEVMSERAQELAKRVSELEAGLLKACEIADEVGCTPEGQTREYLDGVAASLKNLRTLAGVP